MADAPFISGSDILNNSGNAALGIGSGAVPYVGNPANTEPFKGISDAYNTLQQQQAQKDLIDYKNKLDQQDQLAKTLSKFGGGAFNITDPVTGKNTGLEPLPEDKQILQQKADSIRRQMLENPDGYQFDEKLLQDQDEYNNLLRHASMRAFAKTNAYQEAHNTADLNEQKAILDNAKSEIDDHALTDYYQPKPYFAKPVYDPFKEFLPEDVLRNKEYIKQFQSGKEGLDNKIIDIAGQVLPNTRKLQVAQEMQRDFLNNVNTLNPQQVISQNANIDRINQDRGLVQGMAGWTPHIAEVDMTNPQQPQVVPTPYARFPQYVAQNLITQRYGGLNYSADYEKQQTQKRKDEAEINASKAKAAKDWFDIQKGKTQKNEDDYAAMSTNKEISDLYHTAKQGTPIDANKITPQDKKTWVESVKTIEDIGLNPSDYKIYDLPKQAITTNLINETFTPKGTKNAIPLNAVSGQLIESKDGNPDNNRWVIKYIDPSITKKDKTSSDDTQVWKNAEGDIVDSPYMTKVLTNKEALKQLIQSNNNNSKDLGEDIGRAHNYYDQHKEEMYNGGTSGQQPKQSNNKQPDNQQPAQNETQPQRPTSVPKNAVWKQNKKTGSFGWVDNENRKVYDKDGKPLN